MKTTTFTCDACKATYTHRMLGRQQERNFDGPKWEEVELVLSNGPSVKHPENVTHVLDACSRECAMQLVRDRVPVLGDFEVASITRSVTPLHKEGVKGK